MLKFWLEGESAYPLDSPMVFTAKCRNDSDRDLFVLTWNNPLEGIVSNCLRVVHKERVVNYDGLLVMRVLPIAASYTVVPAGQVVSVELQLNAAYSIRDIGVYAVSLSGRIDDAFPVDSPFVAEQLSGREFGRFDGDVDWGGEIYFEVKASEVWASEPMKRLGEQSREEYGAISDFRGRRLRKAAAPMRPDFEGGSSPQWVVVEEAHKGAYALCAKALSVLADDSRYELWFGKHSKKLFKEVLGKFLKIRDTMERTVFLYAFGGTNCKNGYHAATFANCRKIWICDLFWWDDPTKAPNAQRGVILHEHSHAVTLTLDHATNVAECEDLAWKSPECSVQNAASFQFFAENP